MQWTTTSWSPPLSLVPPRPLELGLARKRVPSFPGFAKGLSTMLVAV